MTPTFPANWKLRTKTHFLVAIEELGIRLGKAPISGRRTGIVNVGNARTEEEARTTAMRRAAKLWKTNPIALVITEVQKVTPPQVIWDSEKDSAYSVELSAKVEAATSYHFDATTPTFRGSTARTR